MTVDTEMPVFETTEPHPTPGDAAGTQELLRTMAAVVRAVFGVALQAGADAPAEGDAYADAAEPAQLASVPLTLPSEAPTLVSVAAAVADAPASIAVDFPPAVEVQQPEQPIGLSVVPDPAPAASLPMPSITLADSSWAPPPAPPAPAITIPAYSPAEPAASLPMPDGYPVALAVPAYAAPVLPEPVATDRHSLALLQEIAFLDD